MVEFYVNDILSLPFTLGSSLTGAFQAVGSNARVTAAHRLTLPEVPVNS